MVPTIIYKNASNWVDRGEPANYMVCQALAHFFQRVDAVDEIWVQQLAITLIGMVEADCTDIQLASYMRSAVREHGIPLPEPIGARLYAISIWHMAKAAQVRDFAERVLRGEVPVNAPTEGKLSDWLAARLVNENELSAYKDED